MIYRMYSDVSVTVADARFLKPLDEQLVADFAHENDILITVEEGILPTYLFTQPIYLSIYLYCKVSRCVYTYLFFYLANYISY